MGEAYFCGQGFGALVMVQLLPWRSLKFESIARFCGVNEMESVVPIVIVVVKI